MLHFNYIPLKNVKEMWVSQSLSLIHWINMYLSGFHFVPDTILRHWAYSEQEDKMPALLSSHSNGRQIINKQISDKCLVENNSYVVKNDCGKGDTALI